MTNINPIKFGIGNNYYKQETNEELTKESNQNTQNAGEQKVQQGSDVLSFLAANSATYGPINVKPRTFDVSKYVNEESKARIEGFMKNFEADFKEASSVALDEFPDISEELADKIALAYINASY